MIARLTLPFALSEIERSTNDGRRDEPSCFRAGLSTPKSARLIRMAPDGRGRYSGERFASGIGAGAGRRLVDTALQLRVPLLPPDLAAIECRQR